MLHRRGDNTFVFVKSVVGVGCVYIVLFKGRAEDVWDHLSYSVAHWPLGLSINLFWPLIFCFAESILLDESIFNIRSMDSRSLDSFPGVRRMVGEVHAAKFESNLTEDQIKEIVLYYNDHRDVWLHYINCLLVLFWFIYGNPLLVNSPMLLSECLILVTLSCC